MLERGVVQAKLDVGPADDAYEREADSVAERVMRMPEPTVQRTCAACAREEEEKIRRKSDGPTTAPGSAEQAVADLGPGSPLPTSERTFFEGRLGCDLGGVRVHNDGVAAAGAEALRARAFTLGNRIAFARGAWRPGTFDGRTLLAHELTHVLQQGRGAPRAVRRDGEEGTSEFSDQVTVLSRPSSGPGVVEGTVTRTETAPASGSLPRQEIHRGEMHVRFDPATCALSVPFGYNFVQTAQATGGVGICDDPPAATAVPLLPQAEFNALKTSVLADVNRGLNGWFNVRLTGTACPGGCAGRAIPITVNAHEDAAHPNTTITVVNRGGRADAGTICARSWNRPTAVHEGGHQVLGVGDEYPETDERLRAVAPQWFRRERVRREDWSAMGTAEDTRFARFNERHFNAVKAFLEHAYPGCTAALEARPRPFTPDFRITLGGGYASLSGISGLFMQAGVDMGIPLDRMRRWELVLGPQVRWLNAMDSSGRREAFLLGARLGVEHTWTPSAGGFSVGGFGEIGHGWFSSTSYGGAGGYSDRSARTGYGELGVTAGYRTAPVGPVRFGFMAEGAAGAAFGPGVIGPITPEIERDPERTRWFRLGLSVGGQF